MKCYLHLIALFRILLLIYYKGKEDYLVWEIH